MGMVLLLSLLRDCLLACCCCCCCRCCSRFCHQNEAEIEVKWACCCSCSCCSCSCCSCPSCCSCGSCCFVFLFFVFLFFLLLSLLLLFLLLLQEPPPRDMLDTFSFSCASRSYAKPGLFLMFFSCSFLHRFLNGFWRSSGIQNASTMVLKCKNT